MPPNDFVQRAKRIIRENPEMFSALEEYDRTRRLPKLKYKIRANFTVDADVLRKFRRYCQERGMAMSKVVEMKMKEEMRGK